MHPTWATAIDDYSTAQRVAGRAASTIRLRRDQLSLLARHTGLGPWEIQLADLVAWLGEANWSQERRRSVRTTLRGFYRWAVGSDRLPHNPTDGLPVIRATAPNPRPTPEGPFRRAQLAANPRATLMLRLAADCGLRRAEVAQIHTRDVERSLIGWSLVVHGKGRKIRTVPLPDVLAAQINDLDAGYVFPGQDNGHLSPRWVGRIISTLLEGYGMHSLRHRFATMAYEVDADVLTLMSVLGHASPETTRRYVQVPTDAMRRMVENVSARNGAA